jgi:hypothetical protein
VFIVLGLALAYFGGQFIVKGLDAFIGHGIREAGRFVLWFGVAAVAALIVYREVRRRQSVSGS